MLEESTYSKRKITAQIELEHGTPMEIFKFMTKTPLINFESLILLKIYLLVLI